MNAQFNVNDKVTVLLTEHGVDILRQQHYEYEYRLKEMVPTRSISDFIPPENNVYTAQMWSFMETFGEHMGMVKDNPFFLEIALSNVKTDASREIKELEAMNASFEMRLEEAYDEIGRYKRKVKNAIVVVEESRLADTVRRNLLNELRGALGE